MKKVKRLNTTYSSPLQLQKLDTPHELLELVLHHEETTPRLNVLHRTIRAPLIDLSLQVILSEQFRLTQRVRSVVIDTVRLAIEIVG
jgi:hypothetical protein